jgi:hypothetical protein
MSDPLIDAIIAVFLPTWEAPSAKAPPNPFGPGPIAESVLDDLNDRLGPFEIDMSEPGWIERARDEVVWRTREARRLTAETN